MNGQSQSPPPLTSRASSGLATASLILGILTPLTCGITMIPAIVCGIIALTQIERANGRLVGRAQAISGLVIAIISIPLLGLIAALTVPAVNQMRERSRRAACQSNLHTLCLAVQNYAGRHNGELPPDLESAIEPVGSSDNVSAEKLLICPSATNREVSSYVLGLTNRKLNELEDPSQTPLIIEDPTNHRHGSNVSYADCHVTWKPD